MTRRPLRLRRALRAGYINARRVMPQPRCLPDFLIIGAQRGGTTSLYDYLGAHAEVVPSTAKEVQIFSTRWSRGEAWYRCHVPPLSQREADTSQGRTLLTFEATPYYCFHPHAPARAAAVVPDAKLIFLVRNPVKRAYSHYQHNQRRRAEPLSFEDALKAEPERLDGEVERMLADPTYQSHEHRVFSYAARGRYAEQLESWLRFFPRERIHVVRSEDLYQRPEETYADILDFLKLSSWRPPHFGNSTRHPGGSVSALSPRLQRQLAEEFEPHNRRLRDLLDWDTAW